MVRKKLFFVYILASHTKTLYVGVTSDLIRRMEEHRRGIQDGFTLRYNVKKLVYYEVGEGALGAIAREKQIKGWLRARKIALVESVNPGWRDLAPDLMGGAKPPSRLS